MQQIIKVLSNEVMEKERKKENAETGDITIHNTSCIHETKKLTSLSLLKKASHRIIVLFISSTLFTLISSSIEIKSQLEQTNYESLLLSSV